jgi:hypothetical protein
VEHTNKDGEKSTMSLEMLLGKPMLRLKGSAQLFPISVHTEILDIGVESLTALNFAVTPLTVEGRLALEAYRKENGEDSAKLTRANINVTPEFTANFANIKSPFISPFVATTASIGIGMPFVAGRDQDGHAYTVNPKIRAQAGTELYLHDKLTLSVGVEGSIIPNLIPKIAGRGVAQTQYNLGGNVRLNYHTNSGKILYVQTEADVHRYDVKNVDGSNHDNGTSTFVGGAVGINFR